MPYSRCLLATSRDTIHFIRYDVNAINAHSIRIATNANWMHIKKHISCEHGLTTKQFFQLSGYPYIGTHYRATLIEVPLLNRCAYNQVYTSIATTNSHPRIDSSKITYNCSILGWHGSASLCRDGQKTKWRLQCKY